MDFIFLNSPLKVLTKINLLNFLKEKIKKYKSNGEEIIEKIKWEKWIKGTDKMPVEFNFVSTKLQKFKEIIENI